MAAADVAVYVACWQPVSVPPQAARFARQVAAAAAPPTRARANALLWAAARLAAFAVPLGLDPVPEVLLHPSVIERFAASAPGLSGSARRTVRTNLRFIARRVVPALAPADMPLPRERAKAPYSAAEIAGQEVYEFRHALLQEAVYGELLPGQRARLHGAYAKALAGASAGPSAAASQFAAELAEHWYRARHPAEALAWSVRAASTAERVYAHGEAARHCERALELWDQVPDAAVRAGLDRVVLHTWAARAREHAGDEARALRHVEEALRLLDPAADPARAGLLQYLRGWYAAGKADLDVVLAANQEAVRLVPADPPSTVRAKVLLGYGRTLHLQAGRYEQAAAAHEQALTAARRARSQPDIARAMAGLGYLRALTGEVDVGLDLLRQAYALTERSADAGLPESEELPGDDQWPAVRVGDGMLSEVLLKAGRLEEAADVAARGWETLRRLGLADQRNACVLLGFAVQVLFDLGRWDQATRISEPLAHQPVSFANAMLQARLAELETARGEPEPALARLDQVVEQGWRPGPEHARELGQCRAEAQLWLGQPRQALADVTQALGAC